MADKAREDLGGERPRDQEQSGAAAHGRQVGGGPGASDMASPGGSSGSGGYGKAQNQQFHQGQQDSGVGVRGADEGLGRGERFDEAQGGGRGADSVTVTSADLERDQRAHQDRGQSDAETEVEER
ncbi:hypothetical protein [Sphingosinicella terrae]|uniref:hypothetical protein n=1 Tax=Sphingosinicella terrae TaxID=2172047 RepID=UPI000E0D4021|nr:hypothetical protein [Sphingosinicella terrae]